MAQADDVVAYERPTSISTDVHSPDIAARQRAGPLCDGMRVHDKVPLAWGGETVR